MLKKVLLPVGAVIICLLALVLIRFFFVKEKEPVTDEIDTSIIESSAVMVACGQSVGSGNIYSTNDGTFTVVTAEHIFEDAAESDKARINVTFFDGETATASIEKADKELDVAFLKVKTDDITGAEMRYRSITEGYSNPDKIMPEIGEVIYLRNSFTGMIYAGTLAFPAVYSEDFGRDMILCYCTVDEGMSGTGLFGEDGNYYGMLLGGTEDSRAVCLDMTTISSFFSQR
ncbi:MAG: trypsin-like peptidase domain-containing protein [Butyrivibrio sp.]|nr:trypsin-like peptidase domain-containing protein [Butyrivibrio sp.]